MMNYQKYSKGYFMPPEIDLEWAKKDAPDHAPIWCSVDLRDGNQSLVIPMSLDEKMEFYKMLLKVGFKEIEIGFPAASETEFEFLRRLVEEDLIPDDVTVQVLTQAREHIIRKTFDALKGVKNAIVHVYNSTSVAQRQQVFRKNKEQIKQMAVDGAKLLQELTEHAAANNPNKKTPQTNTPKNHKNHKTIRARSRSTHLRSAMPSSMSGNRRLTARPSSTCRRPSR